MKRRELAKKGLALVLTAAMCAQPMMVSAEEFSFQSEMEDAVVMEAEPEQVEESGEAKGFEDVDGFLSDDSLDEADGMTGDAEGEAEETEADGETDEFVASLDESTTGLDIDESAATVIEGNVENVEGLTWRLDVNGVFYLEGEGELSTYLRYTIDNVEVDFSNYSITSVVVGSKVSGIFYDYCLSAIINSSLQNVIIKDREDGVELKIGEVAFSNCQENLQKIFIGTGVSSIGEFAFYDCKALKEITISEGVEEIGTNAFSDCIALEEVIMPDSVKTYGRSIFSGCMSLKKAVLSKNASVLSYGTFSSCTSLEEIIIPDCVDTYGTDEWKTINTFSGCTSLKKVVLSKNAKTIPRHMFDGCTNLVDVTIPEGVTTIEGAVFYSISPDANLFIPNSVTSIGNVYEVAKCKVTMPCRFALKNGLYQHENNFFYHMNGENDQDEDNCTVCRRTGSCGKNSTYIMTLSGKVTVSGAGTVSGFDGDYQDITSVIIENGISYVDDFSGCGKLESIKFADSVIEFGSKGFGVFENCANLKTITIGKGLENEFTIRKCPKLESVIISSENPNYTNKDGIVYSKDGTRLVYYPANLPGDEYIIPSGVTKISQNAFYYNQNLKKVVIPETVQTINTEIDGTVMFQNCKSLQTVVLNNTVNGIPYYFCYKAESLNEIVIPERTEYISSHAFQDCKKLKTITLPASLKYINGEAFDGCSGLTTVHYLGTAAQWKAIEISDNNEALTSASIHYCTLVRDNATTCDYAGTRDYSCATCGKTFTVNVPKSVHNYSAWKVTRESTCVQEGEEISICSKCGDTKHRFIKKEYHDFEWTDSVEATCEKTGLTQAKKCSNCGYVETAAEVIPAKGHSYYSVSRVEPSCKEKGKEVDRCSNCGKEVTKELPAKGHLYNTSHYPATVLAPETVVKHCSVCGHEEKTETGSKLPATISVNTTSITLKVKQATTKVQVYNLTPGDAIKSWTSSNTKIVKVTDSGKITAQNKTGTANVTVTLLSGKTATIKVKVQKGAVKTTKISGLKNTTLKVKKKLTLVPVIYPITSVQKVTYKSSNKKVATVSSKGVVTAKKKGKTVITVKSGSKKVSIKITVK